MDYNKILDEESEGWGEHVAELFQKGVDRGIRDKHELSLITGKAFKTYQHGYLVEIRVIGKLPQNPTIVVEKGTSKARSPETAERFKQLKSVSMEELAASYKEGYGICQDSIG